jgi:uncharacterized protein YcbK (DUF882 family)
MKDLKKFKRGEDIQLSKNFHLSEFECKCGKCSHTLVNMHHVRKLQKRRSKWKKAIKITSAYRCEAHNKKIGGATHSQHVKGNATDIQVKDMSPNQVQIDFESWKGGMGRYDSFTHIDSRPESKARWDLRKK